MNNFKEMINLVTSRRQKKITIIDFTNTAHSKKNQFLKAVLDGSISNDEEAARSLLYTSAKSKTYLMQKSRLKERLINTLFLLDPNKSGNSKYQKAVYQVTRNYLAAKILISHGARSSGVDLAKSTYSIAKQFDLNEMAYTCAKLIRHHYGIMGQKKEFVAYEKITLHHSLVFVAEDQAEKMYEEILSFLARSKELKPAYAQLAENYFSKSSELAEQFKTFHLRLIHFRIGLLYFQIVRDYNATLNFASKLQEFLNQHPKFLLSSREGEIYLLKLASCIYLKDFEQGITNAQKALEHYPKTGSNWFVVMEHYFTLLMHSSDYKAALEIFKTVTSSNRFSLLPDQKKEEWRVFESYLNYALKDQEGMKKFNVLKFINEVPIFSKDKAGLYPAILIAQILYRIDRNEEDSLEKSMESLRVFAIRNLSKKKAPRTMYFLKMLRQLVNNNYRIDIARRKAKQYIEKLRAMKMIKQGEIDTMEIIPYDNLWNLILDNIQQRRFGNTPK